MFLAACGPVIETTYELTAPPGAEGQQCAGQCAAAEQTCRAQCKEKQIRCEEVERQRAESDYNSYLSQQSREGRPPALGEANFYRNRACQIAPCEATCQQNRHACHSQCGGQIIPRNTCTANCK